MIERPSYDSLVGTVVGHYRLDHLAERHKWGPIFLASDKANQRYAIRFIENPRGTAQGKAAADAHIVYLGLLQQEANRIGVLQYPHIQPLLDYGSAQSMLYLVYQSQTLSSLRILLRQNGPLDMLTIGKYLEQISSALEYAHEHAILHRNLATANIYLHGSNLIIAEFGLLRLREISRRAVNDGDSNGSAGRGSVYEGSSEGSAPEQLLGKPVDTRVDIYAMGAVLYRLLTGHAPFNGKTREDVVRQHLYAEVPQLSVWRNDLPGPLNGVIARAMAKEPIQRYQYPAELVQAYYSVVAPDRAAVLASLSQALPATKSGPVTNGKVPALPRTERSGQLMRQPVPASQLAGNGPAQVGRRRLLVAAGGVVVVAVTAFAGTHLLQTSTSANTTSAANASSLKTSAGGQNNTGQGTGQGSTTPAARGKVLAQTGDIAPNRARTFALDNQQNPGLLIHLPNSQFVAFDSTCTHAGCVVSYNTQNHLLECPCHGAVFDPARGAAVVQGPAQTPLQSVKINVNADGTITRG